MFSQASIVVFLESFSSTS